MFLQNWITADLKLLFLTIWISFELFKSGQGLTDIILICLSHPARVLWKCFCVIASWKRIPIIHQLDNYLRQTFGNVNSYLFLDYLQYGIGSVLFFRPISALFLIVFFFSELELRIYTCIWRFTAWNSVKRWRLK